MRKPEELFDGIFITPETREKIKEAAGERSEKAISQYADELYNALDETMKMIATSNPKQKEYIIYTPERMIGKSQALLRLADKYSAVIIVTEHEKEFWKYTAKELGHTKQHIVSLPELGIKLKGHYIRTIIKSEMVKLADLREKVGDYYIVGIEEV